MVKLLLVFFFSIIFVQCFAQQIPPAEELDIRLSPSITSDKLATLAQISEPITYVTVKEESLAALSGKLYGIKVRMRKALLLLNPDIELMMRRQGKDFFWQALPQGTIVRLPAFSRLIRDIEVSIGDNHQISRRAKPFYWQIGPKTLKAILARNASVVDVNKVDEPRTSKEDGRSAVFPAVPSFHTLKIRSGKSAQARNVLQSLTSSGLATGKIALPSLIENFASPCETEAEVTDDWFAWKAHVGEIQIDRLKLSPVTIAVLDSGVDLAHSALKERFWDGSIAEDDTLDMRLPQTVGIDFTTLPPSNDVQDLSPNSHGTHVSGIAAGAAVSKVFKAFQSSTLLGSNIKIMPLKVVDQDQFVNTQAILNALQFAEKFQAKIISASWNIKKDDNVQLQMLNERGTLFVLAAGNGIQKNEGFEGLDLETNKVFPPAFDLDNAITVGALAANGTPAEFSNYGSRSVQIFAPGCAVTSTLSGSRFGRETGTSQATPFVSLTAALIWSQKPNLSPTVVKNRILQTADPAKESRRKSLYGNLNMAKAVSVMEDLIETADGVYTFGQVLEDKIAIAAPGDTCDETQPILMREQKLTRIYHGYGDSTVDFVIQQNGTRTEGTICSKQIHFKSDSGTDEMIDLDHIRDIVLKMR